MSTPVPAGPGHESPSAHLTGRTGYLLIELGKVALAGADEALAPLGLSAVHLRVLTLAASGVASQQSMVTETGIDRTTMVGLVDDLERLGAARRRRAVDDRRRYEVVLTADGEALLGRALAAVDDMERRMLAAVDGPGRAELHRLAAAVLAANGRPGPSPDYC